MEIAGAGWGTFIGITVAAGINMAIFLSSRINATYETRRTLDIHFGKMVNLLKLVRNYADPSVGAVSGRYEYINKKGSSVGFATILFWKFENFM